MKIPKGTTNSRLGAEELALQAKNLLFHAQSQPESMTTADSYAATIITIAIRGRMIGEPAIPALARLAALAGVDYDPMVLSIIDQVLGLADAHGLRSK